MTVIAVLLFFFAPQWSLATAADSRLSGLPAVEDMEEILYDIPELEDPRLLQHAAFGGYPVLSLMQFAKSEKVMDEEQKAAEIKSKLDDVIDRLQDIRKKLDGGGGSVQYEDIRKSVEELKRVERLFRPDVRQMPPWLALHAGPKDLAKLADKHRSDEKTLLRDSTETATTVGDAVVETAEEDSDEYEDSRFEDTHIMPQLKWEVYSSSNKKFAYPDDVFGKEWQWKSSNNF